MARFYGDIQGHRGEATRMGTPNSGIQAHIRGWNVGARIQASTDPDDQKLDRIEVYQTGGSHSPRGPLLLTIRDNGSVEASQQLLEMLAAQEVKA